MIFILYHISAYDGMMTTNCNELHSFRKDKSLHSFIKIGSDLIVDESFYFVIGLEYLINSSTLKYS
ncbi:MAG: hypothetical protein CR986_03880 [Ignavibacteriae bacterium]|nr:MAG: hypothetical protein CR986_03880 [Ignavibacteriota bacterium]